MRTQSIVLGFVIALAACSSTDQTFDVAYASEWKFSVDGPVGGYMLVVNTSNAPLHLDTVQVVSVTDDHPVANVQIVAKPIQPVAIAPGKAVGMLTPLSKAVLVDSGFVQDSWQSTDAHDLLSIGLMNAPKGTYDIHATANLVVVGKPVSLAFTIHVVDDTTVFADPSTAARVSR